MLDGARTTSLSSLAEGEGRIASDELDVEQPSVLKNGELGGEMGRRLDGGVRLT